MKKLLMTTALIGILAAPAMAENAGGNNTADAGVNGNTGVNINAGLGNRDNAGAIDRSAERPEDLNRETTENTPDRQNRAYGAASRNLDMDTRANLEAELETGHDLSWWQRLWNREEGAR